MNDQQRKFYQLQLRLRGHWWYRNPTPKLRLRAAQFDSARVEKLTSFQAFMSEQAFYKRLFTPPNDQ